MRPDYQASSFAHQKIANRRDFGLTCLLIRTEGVQSPHQKCVGVCEHTLVERYFVPGLVNSLIDGNRMARCFSHKMLKGQPSSEEKFKRSGDTLLEQQWVRIFWRLKRRPSDPANLGHARKAVIQLGEILVGLRRVTPSDIDAEASSPRSIFPRDVNLVICTSELRRCAHILVLRFSWPFARVT